MKLRKNILRFAEYVDGNFFRITFSANATEKSKTEVVVVESNQSLYPVLNKILRYTSDSDVVVLKYENEDIAKEDLEKIRRVEENVKLIENYIVVKGFDKVLKISEEKEKKFPKEKSKKVEKEEG